MWSNFHTHSNYCDGKTSIAECVAMARSQNMVSVGLSSHAPLPFESKWCMNPERLDAYITEISEVKSTQERTQVYSGLEVDYIPGLISPDTFRNRLDYTIGSIHFVEQMSNGIRWEIDGTHQFFLEGLHNIFKDNIRNAVSRYFQLTREMVETSPPDVVGHLDKIKMQNLDSKFFSETDAWYASEIKATLDVIANSNCILEVNTRGIYQKKTTTTYPSPWVLELAFKKNIPITISSDAHHPDDLTNCFSETAQMLLGIGYKKISVLHDNRWSQFEFTPHGIVIK
jgi:histidinol-phosphatase (PHP family)